MKNSIILGKGVEELILLLLKESNKEEKKEKIVSIVTLSINGKIVVNTRATKIKKGDIQFTFETLTILINENLLKEAGEITLSMNELIAIGKNEDIVIPEPWDGNEDYVKITTENPIPKEKKK